MSDSWEHDGEDPGLETMSLLLSEVQSNDVAQADRRAGEERKKLNALRAQQGCRSLNAGEFLADVVGDPKLSGELAEAEHAAEVEKQRARTAPLKPGSKFPPPPTGPTGAPSGRA